MAIEAKTGKGLLLLVQGGRLHRRSNPSFGVKSTIAPKNLSRVSHTQQFALMNNSTLHEAIISFFIKSQRPPRISEVASHFRCDEAEARKGLRALAEYHGVVLHPNSDEIWVAHPFSSAPTTYVVRSGSGVWWGNCAWCSLGLAHLAGGTATIETRIGAIDDHATISIESGKLMDADFVVHFPIPMNRAWDNVIYTCSIMLIFRSESQVDDWCTARGIPKGDVRPIEQVWKFATEWYGRHARSDWKKWSAREAAGMFKRHQLTGPIWSLSEDSERF